MNFLTHKNFRTWYTNCIKTRKIWLFYHFAVNSRFLKAIHASKTKQFSLHKRLLDNVFTYCRTFQTILFTRSVTNVTKIAKTFGEKEFFVSFGSSWCRLSVQLQKSKSLYKYILHEVEVMSVEIYV